ncbi:MAG: rRNA maturation RNase YbeY [Pseudomonadota bacterium]
MPDTANARPIEVDVIIEDEAWRALDDAEAIIARAVTAACRWPLPEGDGQSAANGPEAARSDAAIAVAVLLTNDAHVAELNADFRGKPSPTNVLAFPTFDDDDTPAQQGLINTGEAHPLGDLALAAGVMTGEAEALGKSLHDHTVHLCVHGTLHLRGLDHDAHARATAMEAVETAILATLGVADPYEDAA